MKAEDALDQIPVGKKARRLRILWPLIEAKLMEGVSHAAILDFLNRSGFDLTEATYKSYLYRHRKKQRKRGSGIGEKVLTTGGEVSSESVAPLPDSVVGSKRPATFDYDPRGIPDLLK